MVAQGLKEEGHKVFVVTAEPWRGIFSLAPKVATPTCSLYSPTSRGIGGVRGDIKTYRFYPLNLFFFASIGKYPLFFRLIWRIFDTFNLHSFAVLWFVLKKETPDIVWTHNLTGLGLLTPLLLKILKIPHIHTLHDVALIDPSGVLFYRSLTTISWLNYDKIWGALIRKLFASPALVVSPSKWLMDFYLGHEFFRTSKTLVIQNPIKIPLNPPLLKGEAEEDLEKGEVKEGGEINLLYIGQLEKQKGVLFLISTLDELAAKYNFKLFVAGGGKLFGRLKKLKTEKQWLTVCGKLDCDDLEKIWERTDITIVPSLIYENSPTVIYESLTNGIPVIASRVGGIPELIEDGKNGFLFEAGDGEDLKNKLIAIFENPRILDNLKRGALTFEAKTPIMYVREVLDYANLQILPARQSPFCFLS